MGLLAECWRTGERMPLAEAWLDGIPLARALTQKMLVKAGLLDRTGRIPAESWMEWYGPVADRRNRLRALNESRWGPRGSLTVDSKMASPVPSLPNPTRTKRVISKSARSRSGGGLTPMDEAMRLSGFDPDKLGGAD